MAKIDFDISVFEFSEFESKSEFSAQCKKANTAGLFHIIAYTNCEKEIMIAVNGDGFDYNENLTTGEIENDDCDFGELEPAQLRLDMLQYIRELNNSKNS